MDKLIIEPLIGVNEIKLGAMMPNNIDFLGNADKYIVKGNGWYQQFYWSHQITIQFDSENHCIKYIGIRNLESLNPEVILFGLKVFETSADKMISTIIKSSNTHFLKEDSEIPY